MAGATAAAPADGATLGGAWALIASDIDEARVWWGGALTHSFPNVYVALSHRIAHLLERRGLRPLAYVVAILCQVLTGAEIRPSAVIGPRFVVVHPAGIVVGPDVVAGERLKLFGKNTLGRYRDPRDPLGGSPVVGDDVHIGTMAVLLGPIAVGDGARIGALSLVVTDVPERGRVKAPVATVTRARPAAEAMAEPGLVEEA